MSIKRLLLLLTVVFFVQSCKKSAQDFESDFSLYREYISSFTSGLVSSESDIRMVFAFDKSDWIAGQEINDDLFTFWLLLKEKWVAYRRIKFFFFLKTK